MRLTNPVGWCRTTGGPATSHVPRQGGRKEITTALEERQKLAESDPAYQAARAEAKRWRQAATQIVERLHGDLTLREAAALRDEFYRCRGRYVKAVNAASQIRSGGPLAAPLSGWLDATPDARIDDLLGRGGRALRFELEFAS